MLTYERNLLYTMNMMLDSLLLFLVLALFNKGTTWLDLCLFLLVNLSVAALSSVFFNLKPDLVKVSLACSFLLSATFLWALTSSVFILTIFAVIITWRTTVNWKDPLKPDTEAVLTISALFAGVLSLFQKEGYGVLFGAVFIQFILMLGIKMFLHYLKNRTSRAKIWKEFSPALLIAGLGIIMLVIMGPLKSFVLWIFNGILFVLYYIVGIPLSKLTDSGFIIFLRNLLTDKLSKRKGGETGASKDLIKQKWEKHLFEHDYSILMWSLIALILLVIVIYIWKKRLFPHLKPGAFLAGTVSSINSSNLDDSFFKNRRWLQPKDRTRKKFSQFEKTMFKHGFPRMPGESAPLWFERLKLSGSEAETVLNAYEKVRYGDRSLSNYEFQDYSTALKKLEKLEHIQKKKLK